MTLGNDLVEATTYNNRLQPTLMNAGSGMLKLSFGYGSASALNATQTYAYDAFNRLESVVEGSAWTRSYYYDRYGNRGMQGATPTPAIAPLCATSSDPTCDSSTTAKTPAYTASSNRLTSAWADYDAAGNMLAFKDPIGSGTRDWSAFYDAENKQRFYCDGTTSACSSSNDTAEYVYDGEGNRVKKITSSETTTYVYDAFGRLAAEYSTAGPSGTAGSYFRTTDHLGSTRLVTDGSGAVYDRRDFFPFGEKILASSTYSNRQYVTGYNSSSPASAHLFTAKERDDESGLDYFPHRYLSSALGRWLSPDAPFVDQNPGAPQSWNLYGYVRNSPLSFIDPNGLCREGADGRLHDSSDGTCFTEEDTSVTVTANAEPVRTVPIYPDEDANRVLRLRQMTGAALKTQIREAAVIGALTYGGAAIDGAIGAWAAWRAAPQLWAAGAGPLPAEVAATFRSGAYTEVITTGEVTLYRVFGGESRQMGSFWTRTQPAGPLQSAMDLALPSGNAATSVVEITVPAGTRIFEGTAAPAFGQLGGGSQVYIPRVNPSWIAK